MVLSNDIVRAAIDGDTAAIQELFSTGTRDPDERGVYGYTLLFWAAFYGHYETMCFLLDHGASVNVTDDRGYTPLIAAACSGKHDAAVLLLDRGAQIDLASNHGCTPLILAAGHGHCDMIRLLLSRGAALDAARTDDGRNAEANARYHDNPEAAALLADVRLAGGSWPSYLRYPRKRLLALRVLCERGRAKTDDALLARLFPWHPPVRQGPTTRAARRARAPQGPPELPKEVFWLILKFWRSDRDARDSA